MSGPVPNGLRLRETLQRIAAQHDLVCHVAFKCEAYLFSQAQVWPPSQKRVTSSVGPQYRYALAHWWQDQGPIALWVGYNPGFDDKAAGDNNGGPRPGLGRMKNLSSKAGCVGLILVNLFAYRDTFPKNLHGSVDEVDGFVGPDNDAVLEALIESGVASRTFVHWGSERALGKDPGSGEYIRDIRARAVVRRLLKRPIEIECIGVNDVRDGGQPQHAQAHKPAKVQPWPGAT